ncbi:sugar transferase [Hyphomicrobium sp. 802]|uniref:sugar transferase n=1 Tax=Hyphomicrobium sp. 802 TaxID=1112272 RepID=UPI0004A4F93D|nr:sugar transferase [Hyphomicrobium sp. 802]
MAFLNRPQSLSFSGAELASSPSTNTLGIQLAIKRAVDVFAASTLIVVASPILLGAALAIKVTSRGPILFKQSRYGLNNELFGIYKFRSMRIDLGDATGVRQTKADDPRVTSVGKILRRTNIDELPQLFNVLFGDMSLVGPRPHVPGMRAGGLLYEELVPHYFKRHRMRPGITGLAQINRLRGSTTDAKFAKARIEYDLAYAESWSLFLDFRILWQTFKSEVFRGTGS